MSHGWQDNEVKDPYLAQHLAHWGINMMVMEKTELSIEEVNIQANEKLSLDKITEAGKDLVPLSGPGYVGLKNFGNTCYINSVLQVLYSTPEFATAFVPNAATIFRTAPADPSQDALTQLAKLSTGLLTERYADGNDEEAAVCVAPRMFKALVGKGHAEFSSARQQDAQEYLQHLLTMLQRAEHSAAAASPARTAEGTPLPTLSNLFAFTTEERIAVDGMVCYKRTPGTTQLLLPIPVAAATNQAEVDAYEERVAKRPKLEGDASGEASEEEPVVPLVPFEVHRAPRAHTLNRGLCPPGCDLACPPAC